LTTGTFRHYRGIFLAAILALTCLPASAPARTLIGVVMTGNTPYFNEIHRAFSEALDTGNPQDDEIEIVLQRPFPDPIALSNAARKLVTLEADIIVAYGSMAARAVLQEKSRTPLIYGGVYDPATADISGPNVTGCGYKIPLSSLLRYLRGMKEISVLNVLYCSRDSASVRQLNELIGLAADLKFSLNKIHIADSSDLEELTHKSKGDAFFITGCSVINLLADDILSTLKKHQLPLLFTLPDHNESGATLTLYHNPQDQGRKIAEMTLQVIAGTRPGEIKPEVLRNTELVFNLREVKNLDVKIPFQLIAEATKLVK